MIFLRKYSRADTFSEGWKTFRKRMSSTLNRWWDECYIVKREELFAQALPRSSELDSIRVLEILGVLPEFRGCGIGEGLVHVVEDEMVAEGANMKKRGIYVEANSESNVEMYLRWGFELKAEGHFQSELGDFDMWGLYKELRESGLEKEHATLQFQP
ncbi:hypothetical protein QCA50_020072 [Cerrena zonata]|uniref:N-acetyltransferase domain-containing protein n=1 Tax=Cerrena zonata TaxID=2478898 RepID=A0AAW0FDY3_9APHY